MFATSSCQLLLCGTLCRRNSSHVHRRAKCSPMQFEGNSQPGIQHISVVSGGFLFFIFLQDGNYADLHFHSILKKKKRIVIHKVQVLPFKSSSIFRAKGLTLEISGFFLFQRRFCPYDQE